MNEIVAVPVLCLQNVVPHLLRHHQINELNEVVRIKNFLQTIQSYTDLQFKQHFRVSRSVALQLINIYKQHNEKDRIRGRLEVGADLEIYMTIWYLSNTETYRQISDRFNVTKSSVFRILHRVVRWIVLNSRSVIKWPNTTEMEENQEKFKRMKNISRVVGAIDGTHIKINAPRTNKKDYYNRKNFYSIILQAIVGPNKNFIDVHCGELGSMHDSRVFRRSGFFHQINETPNIMIPRGILLGDCAYPQLPFLVTPYKDIGNLTAKQRKFNYLHSATRVVVEQAFGLLKCRFRRLKFIENRDLSFTANCVVAACVFHNLCIENDDSFTMDENLEIVKDNTSPETNKVENVSITREEIYREMDSLGLLN